MTSVFYLVFIVGIKPTPIITFQDFIANSTCSITHSEPSIKKNKIMESVKNYKEVCIAYDATNQSFLKDPRHAKYDANLIRILFLWAKRFIPQTAMLATILEEDEDGVASLAAEPLEQDGVEGAEPLEESGVEGAEPLEESGLKGQSP
jgi:hypothetical protein